MNVRKVVNHGKTRYLVEIGRGANGRRLRKFFGTRDEAESYQRTRQAELRSQGVAWTQQFDSFTPNQKTELLTQLDRMRRLGFATLREALDSLERTGRAGPDVALDDAVARFLANKTSRGLRSRSLDKLGATLEMLMSVAVRERPLREISAADLREFLQRNGWAAPTRKSYLGDLRTFFRWCVRQKLLGESPADALEAPILEDKPPAVLSVSQCAALLDACQRLAPDLLAWLILTLFAGLRSQEARRLAWGDVSGEFITVTAAKSKTRQRRTIPLSEQMREWLAAAREAGSLLPPENWQKRWKELRSHAGQFTGWKRNTLRHSFASYHFAHFKSAAETSALLGHSEAMLFRHYRGLVAPDAAAAFLALRPDAAALAEGSEVIARLRQASAESRRRKLVEAWARRKALAAAVASGHL